MSKINTRADMLAALQQRLDETSDTYKKGDLILVDDKMQSGYQYTLTEDYGTNIENPETGFAPELSPKTMLKMGVFEGKYLNDCVNEFPVDWYLDSKGKLRETFSPEGPDESVNYFGIKSRQPLYVWEEKEWIPVTGHRSAAKPLREAGLEADEVEDPDVRGWFQWWCRYYCGRRLPIIDEIQQKRWKAYRRHLGQILKNCDPQDKDCRPKQRQGVLQWAYDPLPEKV